MPKLSVYITNYNHGPYLQQSIDSVLKQNYRDFELVIVDDGSTDNSLGIIAEAAHRDNRIKVEIFTENRGAMPAALRAMELCKGEYLFPRAADDYLIDIGFFERAMSSLEKVQAAGAFAASQIISHEGEFGLMMAMNNDHGPETYISPIMARKYFADRMLFIPGASSIWRRSYVDEIGGFDPDLGPQADYYINHLLAQLYGVVDLHGVAAVIRSSPNSYSSTHNRTTAAHEKMERYLAEHP